MDHVHDALRHLKYLRQSLSQDNESIGFFISAGCPLSVSMPAGSWPLIPDVANLTIHINSQLAKDAHYTTLLGEVKKAGKNTENIEDILSFLRGLLAVSKGGDVRGLSEKMLVDLEKLICEQIVLKLNVVLPNEETPYHRLGNWIKSIDRKVAIEVFTTNYDLLCEQALDELEVPYFDGFIGSRRSFFDLRAVEDSLAPRHWTRLWKIHGSINWFQETVGNQKKVYRSSEIKHDASHLIYPSHLKYEESRKMPYLALIDHLSRFIRRKSSFLVLCGYSFNDNHLNDAILNALRANPTGMVLALLFGPFEANRPDGTFGECYAEAYRLAKKQHNLNIWTYDKAIIGTNVGPWVWSADIEEDKDLREFLHIEADKTDATISHRLVKLGDFFVFTNFLKRIIGSTKDIKNVK